MAKKKTLAETALAAIKSLSKDDAEKVGITSNEYAEFANLPIRKARQQLKELSSQGILTATKVPRRNAWGDRTKTNGFVSPE